MRIANEKNLYGPSWNILIRERCGQRRHLSFFWRLQEPQYGHGSRHQLNYVPQSFNKQKNHQCLCDTSFTWCGQLHAFSDMWSFSGNGARSCSPVIFVKQVWIQRFFVLFPKTTTRLRLKGASLLYYLPIAGGRIIGWIIFPRVLAMYEMQTVLFSIWIRVGLSIPYGNKKWKRPASS